MGCEFGILNSKPIINYLLKSYSEPIKSVKNIEINPDNIKNILLAVNNFYLST